MHKEILCVLNVHSIKINSNANNANKGHILNNQQNNAKHVFPLSKIVRPVVQLLSVTAVSPNTTFLYIRTNVLAAQNLAVRDVPQLLVFNAFPRPYFRIKNVSVVHLCSITVIYVL